MHDQIQTVTPTEFGTLVKYEMLQFPILGCLHFLISMYTVYPCQFVVQTTLCTDDSSKNIYDPKITTFRIALMLHLSS
jgi:hypothetical protein